MTKESYWKAVTAKYPQWEDPDAVVKMKASGLKRLLDQAWDKGHSHQITQRRPYNPKGTPPMPDFFKGIFDI